MYATQPKIRLRVSPANIAFVYEMMTLGAARLPMRTKAEFGVLIPIRHFAAAIA
jgi:hypothetical protein